MSEGGVAPIDDSPVKVGEVLAGKYRIERVIGRGGMGVVVSAHHVQLDEKIAIKFLLPGMASSAEVMSRFQREARAAVKIKSEHIARVLDVSQLEDGTPYMVMEYLEGKELAALIEEEGRLSAEDTSELIIQACEAIVEAHSLGIVHRDLKPANLFCVQHADGLPSIKVLDFGISKTTGAAGDMTGTQSMLGSPLYMSPEQMHSSKSVDARTDVWSLGVIMYECVTGAVPTSSDSFPELVYKVVHLDAPSLLERVPDLPPAFAAVVHRCLARDREARYPNIGELALDLLPFASERAGTSVDRIMRIVETSGMTNGVIPPAPSSPRVASDSKSSLPTSEKRASSLFSAPRRTGGHAKVSTPVAEPVLGPVDAKSDSMRGTRNSWTASAPAPSAGKRKVAVLGTFAGTALVGVLAFLAFRKTTPPVVTPTTLPPATTSAEVAMEAPQSSTTLLTPLPVASGSAETKPEPVASASAARPVVAPAAMPVRPVVSAPAPSTKPAVNCTPPYTFDAEGNRVFKRECL